MLNELQREAIDGRLARRSLMAQRCDGL